MLRAVIFDFNGILVDDEPIHLEMFQKVLQEEGISLSEKDYYARYLGFDDRGAFRAVYRDNGRKLDDAALTKLIERKTVYYRASIGQRTVIFPGVKQLLPQLAARYPLAVASGALRDEIELILQSVTLRKYFQVIVSANDVKEGKPQPEIFLKALEGLNRSASALSPIRPSECLVIEDSREGILGAQRAGIKCLAVTNSHPAEELGSAHAIVASLTEVTIPFLESLLK
jgi:HAD superfamily hydrolase (TIGR01509 family)